MEGSPPSKNEEDGQPYLDVKFELNKDIANIIEIVNSILLKMHGITAINITK